MDYLVSPPSQVAWFLTPDDFAARISESWPEAVVQVVSDPSRPYVLEFELAIGDQPVAGAFSCDGQVMALEGDVVACAAVAAWYRRQIPAEHRLVFYDQGYSASVELEGEPGPREIAAPFLSR